MRSHLVAATFALILGACVGLYDPDAPCADDEVLDTRGVCTCPQGQVRDRQTSACSIPAAAGAPASVGDYDPAATSPPRGLGASCSSHDDCADYDATYCESIQLGQCLVRGCQLAPDDCYQGWECCDLSSFGFQDTLCLPEDSCPTD